MFTLAPTHTDTRAHAKFRGMLRAALHPGASNGTRHKTITTTTADRCRGMISSTSPNPLANSRLWILRTERASQTNNYISNKLHIKLFLLIPRTWPLTKFNISCWCRCSDVACTAESEENFCFDFYVFLFTHVLRQPEIRLVCDAAPRTHQSSQSPCHEDALRASSWSCR